MVKVEYAYVGACLLKHELIGLLPIKSCYFSDADCRKAWESIISGNDDIVSVYHSVGSEDVVAEMMHAADVKDAERQGLKIIDAYKKAAFKGALVAAHRKIETGTSIDDVVTEIVCAADKGNESDYKDAIDVMIEVHQDIEERHSGKETSRFIKSGFPDLDALTGGMERGSLVVIAARPSHGKSALALGICQNVGRTHKVAFSSIEMDSLSLGYRLLSSQSGLDLKLLRTATRFPNESWRKAVSGIEGIKSINMVIDDNPNMTAAAVASQARRQKTKADLDLLVVDYIGLLCTEGKNKPRHIEIGEMTRIFKGLAKQLDICVVILCQLNRDAENKKPTLAMLRESGSVEQDADIVIFPYQYIDEKGDAAARLIVAKNRNGPTGIAPISWVKSIASFKTLAKGDFV